MLAEDVERAGAARLAVEIAVAHGLEGGDAFDHLEAVGRRQHRAGRRVVAVVGPPDALDEAFDVLRRADLDDEIDGAPVDAEIEAAGADHGAERARRHRALDPRARLASERAVMEADGQVFGVLSPERLEEQLRLGAGVDEDERRGGAAHQFHHFARVVQAGRAAPGRRAFGAEHGDVRVRAGIGEQHAGPGAEERRERRRVLDGGGQPDAAHVRREGPEARETERELVAAFRFGERVDLVDDHAGEAAEDLRGFGVGQQERERFRRGQQDVRRVGPLARALRRFRVAGAVLDADGETHLRDRSLQIAADVGRERLERRDVERVQARRGIGPERDEARKEPGQRLAAAGRRDQERGGLVARGQKRQLVRMRRPAAPREPVGGESRKIGLRGRHGVVLGRAPPRARRFRDRPDVAPGRRPIRARNSRAARRDGGGSS